MAWLQVVPSTGTFIIISTEQLGGMVDVELLVKCGQSVNVVPCLIPKLYL